MGCDIHTFVEVRSCDKWFFVDGVNDNRNYDFFANLSGVRAYDGEIGFFDVLFDVDSDSFEFSDFVQEQYDRWGSDGHSLTICPYEGLVKMYETRAKIMSKHSNQQLRDWIAKCKKYAQMFDEVRVVVWYDN